MTRAEIRRQQREAAKSGKTYNLNVQQIEEIKKKAMNEALHHAMVLMFALPVLVLHEKYGWGSKKRLPEFAEYLTDYYEEFNEGVWTVEEYEQMVLDYTGIGFNVTPESER